MMPIDMKPGAFKSGFGRPLSRPKKMLSMLLMPSFCMIQPPHCASWVVMYQ